MLQIYFEVYLDFDLGSFAIYNSLYSIKMHSALKQFYCLSIHMCEKDNVRVDHLSKQLRSRFLDTYSINPRNKSYKYIYIYIFFIISNNLKHFKCAIYSLMLSFFSDFEFDVTQTTNDLKSIFDVSIIHQTVTKTCFHLNRFIDT